MSLFFTFSVANFFAKEIPIEKDLYEYNNIVATITKPASPVVSENYIIFTAEASPRFVGIAFDFENYQTKYLNKPPCKVRKLRNWSRRRYNCP